MKWLTRISAHLHALPSADIPKASTCVCTIIHTCKAVCNGFLKTLYSHQINYTFAAESKRHSVLANPKHLAFTSITNPLRARQLEGTLYGEL